MKSVLLSLTVLFSLPLFGPVRATYIKGDTWVSQYLEKGGDIRHVTGLVLPSDWKTHARFDNSIPKRDLPPVFDWRWKAEGLQPVKNQGQCGSCWAFSVTATMEALIKIQTHHVVDLAEQTLVSTCESGGDCGGGYFDAFNYMKSPGMPDEKQDPYKAQNSSCKSNLKAIEKLTSWSYVGDGNDEPTIEQLKTAIMQHGPLSVGIYANSSFSAYKGGVFNNCSSGSENHMVNIEGWNDDGQYWIMRNSWGADWGENGYMNIRYTGSSGAKCNNIAALAAYAVYKDGVLDTFSTSN